jgi:hypothetical protein
MSFLGKILVMVNLVISGLMAGWSFMLFANYVDVSEAPQRGSQPAGLLAQRKEQIKELLVAIGPPQSKWFRMRRQLHLQEAQRQGELAWYRQQLEKLRNGPDPVQQVVLDNFQPANDKDGHPKMADANDREGKPLLSLATYDKTSKDTMTELNKTLHEYALASVEDAELTTKLETLTAKELDKFNDLIKTLEKQVAEAEMQGLMREKGQYTELITRLQKLLPQVGRKGLQQRVNDERAKREGILAEQQFIEPLWKVNEVDTELLLRRRETISERLTELRDYLKKRHKVVVNSR